VIGGDAFFSSHIELLITLILLRGDALAAGALYPHPRPGGVGALDRGYPIFYYVCGARIFLPHFPGRYSGIYGFTHCFRTHYFR
jgi:hypothetical protein